MSSLTRVDVNCDLGEAFGRWPLGEDLQVMDHVTSVNIACGFHAGDPDVMRGSCEAAVERGVTIGAHVGHRDLFGFGRRAIAVHPATLRNETAYQIGALRAIAQAVGGAVAYVKPHGALYNQAAVDPLLAAAIVEAMLELGGDLDLVCPPGSAMERAAQERGIAARAEVFLDRGYRDDGTLMPRNLPGAVIHDPEEVAGRVRRLVRDGVMVTETGGELRLPADTFCVHGDEPGAADRARALVAVLRSEGVSVEPFGHGRHG